MAEVEIKLTLERVQNLFRGVSLIYGSDIADSPHIVYNASRDQLFFMKGFGIEQYCAAHSYDKIAILNVGISAKSIYDYMPEFDFHYSSVVVNTPHYCQFVFQFLYNSVYVQRGGE